MSCSQYDVIVVGAGAAGLSAAIGLSRGGFSVIVVEAAAYPGAENWSGCVYFCENLAHPDLLGPERVEALAWERRLVERGIFATDGYSLLGMTYRDPKAFRHCYTVLRPIYDHHLAQAALRHGVAILTDTTAESLIRDGPRVVGICTQRGPLYADLVFLAEGDASHLVTREGYERFSDPRETPKFLQGIKQVIDMPEGAIESIFGLGSAEGAAYEILVRNGSLRGRDLHLNMGGFVYTNRQSLSIGLVAPLDNLKQNFDGDPNLLMEWFENLPALKAWLRDGKPGVFGAKLIRGGGARDIPTLIDHGLAIGGAASAIGVDFPYPNFTGPATAMGLLLAQAARSIRDQGGDFSRENLAKHYLEPLQQTHYWQDVEFLRRWPAYVKRSETFFGVNLDLVLGTAYVWTRPKRWLLAKWINWLRLLLNVAGPSQWRLLRHDVRHLARTTRVREIIDRPSWPRLMLDGTINALRDLSGTPRPNLPPAGTLHVHYSVAGGSEATGPPPRLLRRWFCRFAPILSAAAQKIYANDNVSLQDKLPAAIRLLVRQINLFDVLLAAAIGLAAGFTGVLLIGWNRFLKLVGLSRSGRPPRGIYKRYAQAAREMADLTPLLKPAQQQWEARLAKLAYQSNKSSHIHLLWPRSLPEKNAVIEEGLWHICPAHVYEVRVNSAGQPQVIVNFENCIKCETCWRGSDLVDWARDGRHRFRYGVHTPAAARLVEAVHGGASRQPALPRTLDPWESTARYLAEILQSEPPDLFDDEAQALLAEAYEIANRLDCKLQEFDEALVQEPRAIDRARSDYLEMLARYAQQLAQRLVQIFQQSPLVDNATPVQAAILERMADFAGSLFAKAEERTQRTWTQRFSWAAADGRQLRFHHLAGLRRCLEECLAQSRQEAKKGSATLRLSVTNSGASGLTIPRPWLRAEDDAMSVIEQQRQWSQRLDAAFPHRSWHDRERQVPLTCEQDATLRNLIAQVPPIDPTNLPDTLHPALRKILLAELGRRDPSLAFRVASHLWARDLVALSDEQGVSTPRLPGPSLTSLAGWTRGDEWTCLAVIESASESTENPWIGEALFVPAASAQSLVLLLRDQLIIVPLDPPGLIIEPLRTLGLRGAGLVRIRLRKTESWEASVSIDGEGLRRVWGILSSADLISIASGMAEEMCRRAVAHATGRVQFPGLFHDEEARDTIGKFGAVKKMLAEMGARRLVIETMDHALSPTDFSAASENRACLLKALTAECLGTRPGSLAYNAGQVFGGTGYSEDDVLSKFYRDAAAWRFLGLANAEVFCRHGKGLLEGWRGGSSQTFDFADESDLFDQITQRRALQAELDETRNAESRLQSQIAQWQEKTTMSQELAANEPSGVTSDGRKHAVDAIFAQAEEALGRWDAERLASTALLLRTHARLEAGLTAQQEIVLLRVWLGHASTSQDVCEAMLRRLQINWSLNDRPIVNPAIGPPMLLYADFLAEPALYHSGDFLVKPVDPAQPRMLPELVEVDPALVERNREIRSLLSERFGKPRQAQGPPPLGFDNYERYIEHVHRPDAADLDFCRQRGFFRMTIPKELGGEGRPKIDYYLLTTNAQRLADVALSLTIQVNTSIGTTPVLLARDKDLPKAVKELGEFLREPELQREIQAGLEKLLKLSGVPDIQRITEGFRDLQGLVAKIILSRTVLRTLFHRFVDRWGQAAKAPENYDPFAMQAHLQGALEAWKAACNRANEYQEELARRREACDRFLQWVSSGQISAFALTEPSAGSDTARLATRAQLRSVPVEEQTDGSFHFFPAGVKEHRVLLDAQRLEFPGCIAHYRWSAAAPSPLPSLPRGRGEGEGAANPAPLRFDEYDYETDDAKRHRYYEADGKKVYFTDIARLRSRNGQLWYDYWELTGAKMWITNGRMAGVMCLYAKTEEGVTAFMVDRHAEGLIVGKDEAKMGQCGSPTNELALQAVRVPRENVIGLEGRGQVNALESLNVGRAGLAMSAIAPMADLIDSCRDFARQTYDKIPAWVEWRLERMQEDRFTAEALAYEVVGRFEHPDTHSLRMESAVAKMLTTELLHDVIEYAEDIHGLAAQTELHLVEKRKRDARVLTIYEGTNEIQRFFILKDLAGEVAPRWANPIGPLSPNLGREAVELEALKLKFRQRLNSALELFGQELWQNPSLQANCFLLSEAAAWLKGADSTLARLAWLDLTLRIEDRGWKIEDGRSRIEDREWRMENGWSILDPRSSILDPQLLVIGRRALTRCYDEITHRLKRFDEELMHLRRGYYAPEIRAASLLFREEPTRIPSASEECDGSSGLRFGFVSAGETPEPARASEFDTEARSRALSILVVVQPTVEEIPHPHVLNGRLFEPFLPLSESSRSALEAALRIRDQAAASLNRARRVSDGLRCPVANAPGSEGEGDSETAPVTVTIQVVAQGARGCASVLREPLSLGVDRVRLIVPDRDAVTPASAAAALATVLGPVPGFDLILGGESPDDQEDGLLVRLLAQAWDIPFAGKASQVTLGRDGHIVLTDSTGQGAPSPLPSSARGRGEGEGAGEQLRPLPLAVAVDKGLTLREFTTAGYLSALSKNVELIRWPRKVQSYPVELAEGEQLSTSTISASESFAGPFNTEKAAIRLLEELGLDRLAAPPTPFGGPIEDVPNAALPGDGRAKVLGIVAADTQGSLHPSALSTLKAVRLLAAAIRAEPLTLLVAPPDDSLQRQAVARCLASGRWDILLLTTPEAGPPLYGQMLIDCWPDPVEPPLVVVGEPWTELAFALLSRRQRNPGSVALRILQVKVDQGKVMLASSRARGKLQAWQTLDLRSGMTPWISLVADADIQDRDAALSRPASGVNDAPGTEVSGSENGPHGESLVRVRRWTPGDPRSGFSKRSFGTKAGGQEAARILDEVKQEIGVARLADADFIVDVGFGVGNRDGYEAVIEPLERALHKLGVRSLAIGGSRKVTEELHLLPADRQIGQSGVSVNPRILLAIGISGAPQHLNYIGSRTTIIAFNRDAEAPMMTLNQRQPRPRVFPIVGDLFETVPAFIAALRNETQDRIAGLASEGQEQHPLLGQSAGR